KSQIGLREGEALTHPWLSKALERAQARVEQQNFEVRKNLLKFDNVMNDQRKAIHEQRREIMEAGDELDQLVDDMRLDIIEDILDRCVPKGSYPEQWDVDTLHADCLRLLALDLPIKSWAAEEGITEQDVMDRIAGAAADKLQSKKNLA